MTDPAAAKAIDSANYTIAGTGEAGASIRIYSDVVGPNDGLIAGESILGTGTVNAGSVWSVTVPLVQNSANNFIAWQKVGTDAATTADVPTITEGAPAAAKITGVVFDGTGGTVAGLDAGDEIEITFNEAVDLVGTGDTISIQDTDGTTATITLGATETTWALTVGDTVLTLTIVSPPFPAGGTVPGILGLTQITAITGFEGADGLAINVAGSGNARNFTVT